MLLEVFVDALCHLYTNGRIEEIGCSYLYCGSSCKQELYCILRIANAAKTDDGHPYCMGNLVNHTQGNGFDARSA